MKRTTRITLIILAAALYACGKDLVNEAFTGFRQPEHFPTPVYRFSTNAITQSGFELGRKLFYDPVLSADNTISCGSCHIQTSAFTHHGHIVSHGIADRMGTRNSPPIMNLAWNPSFMWDGGIFDLDLQAIAPITNHVEMDETMENIVRKLKARDAYAQLFTKAFGDAEITGARLLKALSQFMLLCVSSEARYDSVMRKQAAFTALEVQGYTLFKAKCGSCHAEPLFTDHSFRSNGLPPSMTDDQGRYLITQKEEDRYRFKVPSLRNLAYTAPYMHDGRFLTLDAVLDHYEKGIQPMPSLDPQLSGGITFSASERSALMAFLNTLNDKTFVTNKLLSEP